MKENKLILAFFSCFLFAFYLQREYLKSKRFKVFSLLFVNELARLELDERLRGCIVRAITACAQGYN
jgi:hypothetical protein